MKDINKDLEKAVNQNDLVKVKTLLSLGADVNHPVEKEGTLLHCARTVEMAKVLLSYGASVNASNMYRETPLLNVIKSEMRQNSELKLNFVKELLKYGAHVDATDRHGNTALNLAVKRNGGSLKVIKELIEHGANVNRKNRVHCVFERNYSALDNAVINAMLGCPSRAAFIIKIILINKFENYEKIINLDIYKNTSITFKQLSSYLNNCVCEILQMKNFKVRHDLSLYELVTSSFISRHLSNNELSIRLSTIDFKHDYPIYNDIILEKIKLSIERVNLLDKLSKLQVYSMNHITGMKVSLNSDSVYKISSYLLNEDLLSFIAAFDESNNKKQLLNNLEETNINNNETTDVASTKRGRFE